MLSSTRIFLYLGLFGVVLGASVNLEKTGNLVFAQVLYRHGERTPSTTYPNDPYKSPTDWDGVDRGQMTNNGKRQLYELGKWLRKRYTSLVSETYKYNEIYVRSSDIDRALQSALANLAGFFPPTGRDVWLEGLNWQPIPIHTAPRGLDRLLLLETDCPAYFYALKKYLRSKEYQDLDKKFQRLFEYLTEHTGKKVDDFSDVRDLYSTLLIESTNNKTLPEWTQSVFPGDMEFISAKSFSILSATPQMARLVTGLLFKDILDHFKNKTEGTLKPDRSLWFYSGHDYNIANILSILGLFDPPHNPPFAACVMLEMRLIEKKPYISVFYKNTTAEPEPMYIPRCGKSCPLEKMLNLYSDLLPNDWDEECKLPEKKMNFEEVDISSSEWTETTNIHVLLFDITFKKIMSLVGFIQDILF